MVDVLGRPFPIPVPWGAGAVQRHNTSLRVSLPKSLEDGNRFEVPFLPRPSLSLKPYYTEGKLFLIPSGTQYSPSKTSFFT